MKKIIQQRVITILSEVESKEYIILGIGVATFFFGFAVLVLVNVYLLRIDSPVVTGLRTTLTYNSALFGDGIILPIVNMIATSFLLTNKKYIGRKVLHAAVFLGIAVTVYLHINQAVLGLVNWAMPAPWRWNALGAYHALFMLFATSFLSLFCIIAMRVIRKEKQIPKEAIVVTSGVIFFLLLLRLDYLSVSVSSLIIFP